jgi:hypothetical protein
METFERTRVEDELSDGQIVFLRVLHQFIATPGAFLLGGLIVVVVLPPVSTHSLSAGLASMLICLCAAFSVGYGFGRLSPPRARLGYWSWVLPTLAIIIDIWSGTTLYNSTFAGELKKHFYPYDDSTEFGLLTIPWLQSFIYSFGLWLAIRYSGESIKPMRRA